MPKYAFDYFRIGLAGIATSGADDSSDDDNDSSSDEDPDQMTSVLFLSVSAMCIDSLPD